MDPAKHSERVWFKSTLAPSKFKMPDSGRGASTVEEARHKGEPGSSRVDCEATVGATQSFFS